MASHDQFNLLMWLLLQFLYDGHISRCSGYYDFKMRTLQKGYARYSREEDLDEVERDLGDEYGWKQVHGDVFRPPSYSLLLSSLIGTGYQLGVYCDDCNCFYYNGGFI